MQQVANKKAIAVVVKDYREDYNQGYEYENEPQSEQQNKELELQNYIEKIDAELCAVRKKLEGSKSFKMMEKDLTESLKSTFVKHNLKTYYLPQNKQNAKLEKEEIKFRFNTTKFKSEHPDLYEAYTEQKASQLKIVFEDSSDGSSETKNKESEMDSMFENNETGLAVVGEKNNGIIRKVEK